MVDIPLIEASVTYLEMTKNPNIKDFDIDGYDVSLESNPDFNLYIKNYRQIGDRYYWVQRYSQSKEDIKALLTSDKMYLYYLRYNKEVIGMAECHKEDNNTYKIAYFGLKFSYINRGLGKKFLNIVLCNLWKNEVARVYLDTCSFDHPQAISFYQKHGFKIFDRKDNVKFKDYRFTGLCDFYDTQEYQLKD